MLIPINLNNTNEWEVKMKKIVGKILKVIVLIAMLFGSGPVNVFALESEPREPLMFENFEDADSNIHATNDAKVGIVAGSATGSGNKVASLEVTSSDWPSLTYRSMIVKKEQPVDVSSYKYVTLWVKDAGANSVRLSLIDSQGQSIEGEWTGNVTAGKWTQVSISLDLFSALDLTQITGIYVGEWNAGTYLIDDIQFSDITAKDLAVSASMPSGTYNDTFEVSLSAQAGQTIYYTTDGSQPTNQSTSYREAIEVDDDMLIKAIAYQNGNISDVYEFDYKIDHSDNSNYTPVVVQTFEDGINAVAASNASCQLVSDEKHNGKQSLKYVKEVSNGTSKTDGNVKIDFNHPVNVTDLKYFIFHIKDTQGSNTMQLSLIDADGNESSYDWRSPSTSKNNWSQYYIKLSDISGIDKTKVTGVRMGQWNAGTYYIDDLYFDNYLSTGVPDIAPSQPKANIESGYIFKDSIEVSLTNDMNASMYYTLDGSQPTVNSTKYDGKITLNDTATIKAVSYDNGEYSEVVTLDYYQDSNIINDVVASKVSGKYSKEMSVALQADGLDIYYTLDGSSPTLSSAKYTEAITVKQTTVIKAVSYDGNQLGNVMTFEYKFPTAPQQVYPSTDQLLFNSASAVELLSDPDATIYYTTDGSDPTVDSNVAQGYITIDKTMTIKAVAIRDGKQSDITTLDYVIAPNKVAADKAAGTYDGSVVVEFRVPDTDQVEIYYTTDGSNPTIESTHYTQPLLVSENTVFKVAATYKNSDSLSEVATHEYVINPIEDVVKPEITPDSGKFGQRQLVSMTTATDGGEIYYTLDGTNPDENSFQFTDAFYVTKDTVIKAVTIKNGKVSDIAVSEITITDEQSVFLKTDGKVIRNNYGAGEVVQLKGTNIGGWLVMENWQCPVNSPDQKTTLAVLSERFGEEKAWELINIYQDNWFTEDDFAILKEEGVNCLRLPITYFEMCDEDGSLKETAFDRLDWFIENAAKYNIYTLIDMHGAFGSQNGKDHSGDTSNPDVGNFFGNEENITKTIKLWEAIAKRYKDNAWVAGYDLLNEPGGAVGTEQFEVYDRLYNAVRAIDQDHIIQMQAIWEPTHLPNPELYGWENVVYQYHFYGWDVEKNADGQKAFIESKVKYLEDTNYNVPVFVGEFTFFSNEVSWDYGLEIFNEQGWSYTSWTYKVSGDNSSWGMYTMPDNSSTKVDIYNDSFETIKAKWSSFNFTRNDKYADKLSKYMKETTADETAPVIEGNDAKVQIGTNNDIQTIINLFVKDDHDGVIKNDALSITSDFNADKAGVYSVKIVASDQAGNTSEANYTIEVLENTEIPEDPNQPVDSGDSNNTDQPIQIPSNNQNNTSDTDQGVSLSSSQAAKTGDDLNLVPMVLLSSLSMLGIFCLKKKYKF